MNARPSGIQRLAFHICKELQSRNGSALRVRFLRVVSGGATFTPVAWQEVERLFLVLANQPSASDMSRPGPLRNFIRKQLRALPKPLHRTVVDVGLTALSSARAWSSLFKAIVAARQSFVSAAKKLPAPAIEGAAPGDVLLSLGSGWSHPHYAALIARHRDKLGLRFGVLIHDLIPVRRPEWFDAALVATFTTWLDGILPLCDFVFANSRATAADLECYLGEIEFPCAAPVTTLPIGTDLGMGKPAAASATVGVAALVEGDYVLTVSTIEVRKNHLLLFRAWRRLLDELPADQVPSLVFAGRVGWLVDDLMRQIANTANLRGKLIVVNGPTDDELDMLYAGCLFTVIPSFREGWGLPVTESLARGKPCLISNAAALVEAGGDLARSFDPDDLNDAFRQIKDLILDRASLAAWQADVQAKFDPIPWSATADAMLARMAESPISEGPGVAPLALDPERAPVRSW